MPRSLAEIVATADALASRFERHEPETSALREAAALREVGRSAAARAAADAAVLDAVVAAREDGHSWAAIGAMLGTSGEAARQRYAAAADDVRERIADTSIQHDAKAVSELRPIRWKVHHTTRGGAMAGERTGRKAASNAGRAVAKKAGSKTSKSAAGSALSQRKSSGTTGKSAASAAGKTLGAKKATKAAKSAAGSALTQKPSKKSSGSKK